MRDTRIARRTLLAVAAALAAGWWPIAAEAHRRHHHHHHHHHHARRHRHRARRKHVVVLDPGHGGIDPGAISPRGYKEKRITLATARELARLLRATHRYRVVLTRRRDRYVGLRARVRRARAVHAELFVSIHADALPNRHLRGLSVYTLSDKASDRETAALASRENRDFSVAGVQLRRQPRVIGSILLDLARRHTDNQSLKLAHDIVKEMGRRVPLLERPHRAAGFVVLSAPDVPSVLVELGCLSNPKEERLLVKHSYQRRLAIGLEHAINDYFSRKGSR